MRGPFCRGSGRRRVRHRPARSGAGRVEPVLADQGAGLAHEREHELVPEGRQHHVERVELERDVLRRGLAELAGQARAQVDGAGHLGGDGVGGEAGLGVGGHHEAVARDEEGGDDARGLAVGSQSGGEGVGLVAHSASKAVSSWRAYGVCERVGRGAVGEHAREAVGQADQLAEEDARARDRRTLGDA